MAYNRYRKRYYVTSGSKKREYAQDMERLSEYFENNPHWDISSHLDSAYRNFDSYTVRLSNHAPNNRYHDLDNGDLLINVRKSKMDFQEFIESGKVDKLLEFINTLDLNNYRFINVVEDRINCFVKFYKQKKEVFKFEV